MIIALLLAATAPEIVEPGAHCSGVYARHIVAGQPPLHNDPYAAYYRSRGEGPKEARDHRVTVVVETCQLDRASALAELVRVDQAYGRIRHPTARQTAAFLRKWERLSPPVCQNGMNDDDHDGNVGCD